MKQSHDIFDATAAYVPAEFLTEYWRIVARLRELRSDDEILQLFHGMGILTFILRDLPKALIDERKLWKAQLDTLRTEMDKMVENATRQAVMVSNQVETLDKTMGTTTAFFREGTAQLEKASREAVRQIDVEGMAQRLTARIEQRVVNRFDGIAGNVEQKLGLLTKVGESAERSIAILRQLQFWPLIGGISSVILVLGLILGSACFHSIDQADKKAMDAKLAQIQTMATANQEAFALLARYDIQADVVKVISNGQPQFGQRALRLTPALGVHQETPDGQPKSGIVYFPIPITGGEKIQQLLNVQW